MVVIRHLLTHSSGMGYVFMDPLLSRYQELQGKQPPNSPRSVVSCLVPTANTFDLPLIVKG